MTAAISTYLRNTLLDHAFGLTTFTPPGTLYGVLFTTVPDADDAGGVEFAGGANYARAVYTNNTTNFANASGGIKLNGAQLAFPTPSGRWAAIAGYGIRDASSGGNLWLAYSFPIALDYMSGEPVAIDIGSLSISLP